MSTFNALPPVPGPSGHAQRTPAQVRMNADMNDLLYEVAKFTVDKLKAALKRFNSETRLSRQKLTGVKADLTGRVRECLWECIDSGNEQDFNVCKTIIRQTRDRVNMPAPTSSPMSSHSNSNNNYGTNHAGSSSYINGSGSAAAASVGGQYNRGPGFQHYADLPPPRFSNQVPGQSTSSAAQSATAPPIKFRPSPFFHVETHLTNYVVLPRAGQGDRKTAALSFSLNPNQRQLLTKSKESKSNDQYAVCVYCTTEEFFATYRSSMAQPEAYIEFPQTCELRINNQVVSANTKGIRKQPGSAPPAIVSNNSSFNVNGQNRLEIVYINTERREFMMVNFVKLTSVAELVNRIKKGKFRSKESVIESIVRQNDDPDLEASIQGLTLKDPLTMMRIKTPVRGTSCTHVQCYDAQLYLQMNEQTPSWKCPVCSKQVRFDDLMLDGFFQHILQICPDSVDAIEVEPNGTWRSLDSKYGTAAPKKASSAELLPPSQQTNGMAASSLSAALGDEEQKPDLMRPSSSSTTTTATTTNKKLATESLTINTDDEDDDDERDAMLVSNSLVRPATNNGSSGVNGTRDRLTIDLHPPATSRSGTSGTSTPRKQIETLDLTLSSDDDDDDDDDGGPIYHNHNKRPRID